VVDKPAGMTSHDVVSAVRRSTGEGRVGHAGTLDPAATGVLVVLLGPATRLAPFLTAAEKAYDARIAFGTQTETDDAEGTPVRVVPVPDTLADPEYARSALQQLIGAHDQLPPAYSAVKRGGVVAHRAARAGEPLSLEPRRIEIVEARLHGVEHTGGLVWDAGFVVSKGTYLRSIARDLGEALGTAAHLVSLRRSASGTITLSDAHTLDEVVRAGTTVAGLFIDPVTALALPVRELVTDEVVRVQVGEPLPAGSQLTAGPGEPVALADAHRLHAVYRVSDDGESLRPSVVLAGGIGR
jgi:tRNA pseudouridine55 synthase